MGWLFQLRGPWAKISRIICDGSSWMISTTYDFYKSIFFRHQRSRSQFWQIKRWGTSESVYSTQQLLNFDLPPCQRGLTLTTFNFNDNIILKKWKKGRADNSKTLFWQYYHMKKTMENRRGLLKNCPKTLTYVHTCQHGKC